MIGWISGGGQSRIERRAYKWVMHMLDDPTRYGAGLEQWLAKSPEHRAVYKRVAVEVGYASDAATQIAALRVAAGAGNPRGSSLWSGNRLIPVGLVVVMAFVAFAAWHVISSQWESHVVPKETSQMFAADRGNKTIRLDDGSIITLSGGSQVVVRYSALERGIDLIQGRARFSVDHDPSRPFVVYVSGGKVTAVGTLFEVEAGDEVLVKLLTGRVIVTGPATFPSSGERNVTLTKGQEVSFKAGPRTGQNATPPVANTLSRDVRTFDDVPVSEVLLRVNSHSQTKIVLSEPSIGEQIIFADLNVDDPAGVARKLAMLLNLRIDNSRPGEIILSRNH